MILWHLHRAILVLANVLVVDLSEDKPGKTYIVRSNVEFDRNIVPTMFSRGWVICGSMREFRTGLTFQDSMYSVPSLLPKWAYTVIRVKTHSPGLSVSLPGSL